MFGLHKTQNEQSSQKQTPEVSHDIEVIPDIFYGGKDPDIYNEKTPETKTTPKMPVKPIPAPLTATPQPAPPRPTLPPRPMPPPLPKNEAVAQTAPVLKQPQPASSKKRNKVLLVGGIILILLTLATASWLVLRSGPSATPRPVPPATRPAAVVVTSPLVEAPLVTSTVPTSTPIQESASTSSLQNRIRSLPIFSLAPLIDGDKDSVTDAEEELFQTDPAVWDSDSDGYYDGQEVYNLYNPKGLAPMRIIDSGLVQEYTNPTWQYRVYYPVLWQATAIDERDGKQVLFNSITGDYIEIKVSQKLPGESFPGWFGRVVGDQIYTDLISLNNRFQVPYYKRKDGLVSYFEGSNEVYILILYSRNENINDFPHVFDILSQSFRLGKGKVELPDQVILPQPGVATSSLENF